MIEVQATHEGVLKLNGVEVPCSVLKSGRRVLTQQGFLKAIGRARSAKGGQGSTGGVIPFLAAKNLQAFVDEDMREYLSPIACTTVGGRPAFGFPAEALPKVCEIFIKARDKGVLTPAQIVIAGRCELIRDALALTGIIGLVDEATGYQFARPIDALQAYLEAVIRKELAAWSKRFPDEFYENIYKLRGWRWPGMNKNRYSVVAHYTRNLVYNRLGPGVLAELEHKNPPDPNTGRRKAKFHQWLTDDVGHPKLAQHLHTIIMFQRHCIARGYSYSRFVAMVDEVMPESDSTLVLPMEYAE